MGMTETKRRLRNLNRHKELMEGYMAGGMSREEASCRAYKDITGVDDISPEMEASDPNPAPLPNPFKVCHKSGGCQYRGVRQDDKKCHCPFERCLR